MSILTDLGLTPEDINSVPSDRMIDMACAVFGDQAKDRIAFAAFDAWAACLDDECEYWTDVFKKMQS